MVETAAFEALVEEAARTFHEELGRILGVPAYAQFDNLDPATRAQRLAATRVAIRAVLEKVLTPGSEAYEAAYAEPKVAPVSLAFAAQRAKYLDPLAAVFAKVAASTRDQYSYAERRSGRERRKGERRRKNFLTDRRSLPQSGRRGLVQRRRTIRRRADREDGLLRCCDARRPGGA